MMKRFFALIIAVNIILAMLSGCDGGGREPEDTEESGIVFSEVPIDTSSPVIVVSTPHFSITGEMIPIAIRAFGGDDATVCRFTADSGKLGKMGMSFTEYEENVPITVKGDGVVSWRPVWVGGDVPMTESFAYITAVFSREDITTGFALIEIEDDGWGTADAKVLYQCSFPMKDGEYQEISDFYIERRVIELKELSRRKHESEGAPEAAPIREEEIDAFAFITAVELNAYYEEITGGYGMTLRFSADPGIECSLLASDGDFRDPLAPGYEVEPILRDGDSVYWCDNPEPYEEEKYATAIYREGGDIVGFAVIPFYSSWYGFGGAVRYQCVFPRIDGERQPVTEEYVRMRAEEIMSGSVAPTGEIAETELSYFGQVTAVELGRDAVLFEFESTDGAVSCRVSADVGEIVHDDSYFDSVPTSKNAWEFKWIADGAAVERSTARITAVYYKDRMPVGYSVIMLEYDGGSWHAETAYECILPLADGEYQHVTPEYIMRRADEISEQFERK